MSKDFPAQFGRSDLYRNPEGTLPMPSPSDIPRPLWSAQKVKFRWTDPEIVGLEDDPFPPGVLWRYTWSSPAFDLRPDLRSAQSAPKDGVPIWGTACRLYVQLMSGNAGTGTQPDLDTSNLTAEARDWINDTFNYSSDRRPGEGVTGGAGLLLSAPVDVSSKFAVPPLSGATTSLVVFAPPGTTSGTGEGYPVRYWRLQLDFTQFVETEFPVPDPPPMPSSLLTPVLQVSMY